MSNYSNINKQHQSSISNSNIAPRVAQSVSSTSSDFSSSTSPSPPLSSNQNNNTENTTSTSTITSNDNNEDLAENNSKNEETSELNQNRKNESIRPSANIKSSKSLQNEDLNQADDDIIDDDDDDDDVNDEDDDENNSTCNENCIPIESRNSPCSHRERGTTNEFLSSQNFAQPSPFGDHVAKKSKPIDELNIYTALIKQNNFYIFF
jgi:hypothetical protein